MTPRILCVDDDPNVLAAYQRNLRKQFSIETALGGEEALAKISLNNHFAVIVADMQMPGMTGVQFLIKAQQLAPDSVRMMLTGNADQHTAKQAVNEGHVFRFLSKPCPPEELSAALSAALKQHALVTAERELLEKTLSGSVRLLTEILSFSGPEAFGRGQALRECALHIAGAMHLGSTWELGLAALLSQIGCLTLPAALMTKLRSGQEPTSEEIAILTRVPEIGANLLAQIPRLEGVATIIRYQHKYFDGSGFPGTGLQGTDLPLASRILAVASDLIHLKARGVDQGKALDGLCAFAHRYDPEVLKAACACFGHKPEAVPATPASASAEREVNVADLHAGMVMAHDVHGLDGSTLASAGTRLSVFLLEILVNYHRLQGLREPLYVTAETRLP